MKTKIYTKTGDSGETSLIGGLRVSKSDPRLEVYGTVDELNSIFGLCLSQICESNNSKWNNIRKTLESAQHNLFTVGSLLACADMELRAQLPKLDTSFVKQLEAEIDEMNVHLPELKEFILPGGSEVASLLHLSRTVCRRAERFACRDNENGHDEKGVHDNYTKEIIVLLNRLSDYLFVAARFVNWTLDRPDIKWQKSK